MPLLFQSGSEWNYGVSRDVSGRVIEVIVGQSLDEFFAAVVIGPLNISIWLSQEAWIATWMEPEVLVGALETLDACLSSVR